MTESQIMAICLAQKFWGNKSDYLRSSLPQHVAGPCAVTVRATSRPVLGLSIDMCNKSVSRETSAPGIHAAFLSVMKPFSGGSRR